MVLKNMATEMFLYIQGAISLVHRLRWPLLFFVNPFIEFKRNSASKLLSREPKLDIGQKKSTLKV